MLGKILVVDDNRLNIKILQHILEEEDYEVHILNRGSKVLERSIAIKPDAILLDIIMPGMDGFEVCRLLKENPSTKDIPVIMVTAKTDGNDLRKAFSLGAFDYIKKPIDDIEVVARLNSAIRFKEQQKKLEMLAMKDGLTGLYNHRLSIELFQKQYAKSKGSNKCLAFVMIDIDHFKNVNDSYGHRAGDKVLRGLADILQKNSHEDNIVGRYGGEEFCIIIPYISVNDAYSICERIRKTVEKNTFKVDNMTIRITISIGNCIKLPTSSCSCEKMIAEADKALYKAKNTGRNRTVTSILN